MVECLPLDPAAQVRFQPRAVWIYLHPVTFGGHCGGECHGARYRTHFYCLAVEAGFYSDVVECLPLDPAAQVRFPPRAVGIFLHPVTFGGQYVGSTACVSGITQQEMSRNYSVVPTRFGDESI